MSELTYHLLLAHDLEPVDLEAYDRREGQATEVERMRAILINRRMTGD